MMTIQFNSEHVALLKKHVEKEYPHEACGFFIGEENGDDRVVTEIWPVKNVSNENQRRRFVIDPRDYLDAELKAQRLDKALLGIYHSHPDHPARPSEHDLASAQPYFSYVIANVDAGTMGEVRSYRLGKERFEEEKILEEIHIHQNQ